MSPFDSHRMLVGGDMLGVGLTTDGGRSWQATTGFASWEINEFTWDPSQASTVWVGTLSGPYQSVDGGRTWRAMRNGMPTGDMPYSAPIQKVLVDSSDDEHLLAFGGNQRQMEAGGTGALNYGLVYESTDGGRSWSTISSVGANANVLSVVASSDLRTVYAAVLGRGVVRSTDGGHTWQSIGAGLAPGELVSSLAIDPAHPGTVWAALSRSSAATGGSYRPGGIDRTVDGGQSWTPVDAGLPQNAGSATWTTSMLSIYRAGDGTLWTADMGYGSQQRFKSTDGGTSWTAQGGAFTKAMPAGAMPYAWSGSADGSLVVGGTSDSIIATGDGGASWQALDSTRTPDGGWHGNGYSGLLGTRVAFDAARPGTIFTSALDAGNLMQTTNGGASWSRPLTRWDQYDGGYDVATGGPGGDTVYEVLGQQGMFNGIAVSHDGGATFGVSVGGGLPARYAASNGQGSIAIASSDGATAYAVLPNHALVRTTDGGQTWSPVALPSPAWSVAASPDHSTVYVGTDAGIDSLPSSGAGSPTPMSGSPLGARRLVVVPGAGTVYAVGPAGLSAGGIYTNRSGSWAKIVSSHYTADVAVDPTDPQHVVWVSNDNPYHTTSLATGVWVSCDGGQSFAQDNAGLPMTRVLSVAFDPDHPEHIVIGTNGRGFWQTSLTACS